MLDKKQFEERVAELMAEGLDRREAEIEVMLEEQPEGDVLSGEDDSPAPEPGDAPTTDPVQQKTLDALEEIAKREPTVNVEVKMPEGKPSRSSKDGKRRPRRVTPVYDDDGRIKHYDEEEL